VKLGSHFAGVPNRSRGRLPGRLHRRPDLLDKRSDRVASAHHCGSFFHRNIAPARIAFKELRGKSKLSGLFDLNKETRPL